MPAAFRQDFSASPWVLDVLTHLWQSSVVALAILLLLAAARGLSARTRAWLAWIALAKFALPIAWWLQRWSQPESVAQLWLAPATESWRLPVEVLAGPPVVAPAAAAWSVGGIATGLWAMGAVALFAGWLVRARRARVRLLTATEAAPAEVVEQVAAAARRVELTAPPRCVVTDRAVGPAVVGIVRPTLVLPRGLLGVLSGRELDAIVLHECVHVRRQDNLRSAVRAGVGALLWFNPVVWLVNRVLAIETEKSCDEEVLALTGDAEAYASGLVAAVRHALGAAPAGAAAATTPPVVARLREILAWPGRPDRAWRSRAAVATALALAALGGHAGSIAATPAAPEPRPAAPEASGNGAAVEFLREQAERLQREAEAATSAAEAAGKNAQRADVLLRLRAAEAGGGVAEAATKPRRVVGEVAISGEMMTTEAIRALKTASLLQRGVPFDEVALDRSVRALYATGQFESIEVRTRLVDGATVNVSYVVRLKGAARADDIPGLPAPGDTFEIGGPKSPAERAAEALAEAQRTVAETQAELAKLREARAVALAREQELEAAAERARVAAGGAAKEPPEATSREPQGRSIVAPIITPPVPPRSGYTAPVIPIAQLDQRPVARLQTRPRYPYQLRKNGVAGEAVVDFVVDAEGNVAEPVAVRMTHEEFGAAAVDAVRRWQFKPGMKDGRAVATQLQVPIVFTLNEN